MCLNKVRRSILIVCCIVGLAACRIDDLPPTVSVPTPETTAVQPNPVSHAALAADPYGYQDTYLQLTGEFSKVPQLICGTSRHASPAGWGLTADSLMALADGYGSQLNALAPQRLMITANGWWRQWQGLVGCGKTATMQTVWYLEVDEIVSPNPLVQVTLTRASGEAISAAVTAPEMEEVPAQPTQTPEIPTATAAATLPGIETVEPEAGTGTPTPDSGASPISGTAGTPTIGATSSLTPTRRTGLGVTLTATAAPGTATATPAAGTGTATPLPTNTMTPLPTVTTAAAGAPTATATSPAVNLVVNQGPVVETEMVGAPLAPNQTHSWDFTIDSSAVITVNVAASSSLDIVISIFNQQGTPIIQQNIAAPGQIERISALQLPSPGDYQITIRAAQGNSGHYAMMFLLQDSYNFVGKGILSLNEEANSTLEASSDHFWFFEGQAGDIVSIVAIPEDSSNLFLELYDPDGEEISGFVNDHPGGQQEQISQFTLPDAGIYSIRIGEYDFAESSYQIRLLAE